MGKNPVIAAAALAIGLAGPVSAAEGPPDGSKPEEKAAIANDPAFVSRTLILTRQPKGSGKTIALFDGKTLAGWDSWLGYSEPLSTYGNPAGQPIGLNNDKTGVFKVVTEDGRPAIYASGKLFGGLITQKSYRNYHLRLQYKWGPNNWMPMPRNNGLLYHSHGRYGAFFGTWMTALEFEIVPKSVGMLLTVGDSGGTHSFATVDWKVGADVEIGRDPATLYPHRRYMPGGKRVPIRFPAFNVLGATDAERPAGEWNTLDLYVFGDRSLHLVNGVPVLAASHLTTRDDKGRTVPLTAGRIQLQSEGTETFFRDITLTPITAIPRIVAK